MTTLWQEYNKTEIPPSILEIAGDSLLASLLIKRHINTAQKASDFLYPLKMDISSPDVFLDVPKAVARINDAIQNKQKITIWGDFDADGITSTSVLLKTLRFLGANVDYHIPSREDEGHGLNTKFLTKLISKNKTKLIITVDCGISNIKEVQLARSFGTDVIITDHHEANDELPPAYAIINPKAPLSLNQSLSLTQIEYLSYLAGVGVAYKLATGLLNYYNKTEFIQELLPFVAVGTIADVVPVLGENRNFIIRGLQLIQQGKNKAIKTLLDLASINAKENLTSENIAFAIAPRLNATGRLSNAEDIVNFLLSEDEEQLKIKSSEINQLNHLRQEMCEEMFNEVINTIDNNEQAVIVCEKDWHIGIIGIVAAKITEKFYKPAFLMSEKGDSNIVRCSARSVPEVHLHKILEENSDLFENYGGHSLAAGFGFDKSKHSFEEVKSRLLDSVKEVLQDKQLVPTLDIDLTLQADDVNFALISTINKLEPTGAMNNKPILSLKDLTLHQYKVMGQNQNHLKLFLNADNQKTFECVYWNHSKLQTELNEKVDIAFSPTLNTFNNVTTLQLDIKDIKYHNLLQEQSTKILDHRQKNNLYDQINDYISNSHNDVVVYAYSEKTRKKLENFAFITERIINSKNIQTAKQLMIFDYPTSPQILNQLIKTINPQIVHIMANHCFHINPDEFIKTFSGMLKYAYNHKNGEINKQEIAGLLATNVDIIDTALELLFEAEVIEIIKNTVIVAQIKFLAIAEFRKIAQIDLYDELCSKIHSIIDFQKNLSESDINSILDIAS